MPTNPDHRFLLMQTVKLPGREYTQGQIRTAKEWAKAFAMDVDSVKDDGQFFMAVMNDAVDVINHDTDFACVRFRADVMDQSNDLYVPMKRKHLPALRDAISRYLQDNPPSKRAVAKPSSSSVDELPTG